MHLEIQSADGTVILFVCFLFCFCFVFVFVFWGSCFFFFGGVFLVLFFCPVSNKIKMRYHTYNSVGFSKISCLQWGIISNTSAIPVLKNDRKCKCIIPNSVRKMLIKQQSLRSNLYLLSSSGSCIFVCNFLEPSVLRKPMKINAHHLWKRLLVTNKTHANGTKCRK